MDQTANSNKTNWPAFILILAFAVLVVAIVVIIALTGNKKENSSQIANQVSTSGIVSITKNGFSPATITVQVGSSVTWTNKDTFVHIIASDPYPKNDLLANLKSDPLNIHDSYTFTFEKIGKFTYHDENNPFSLKGEVDVR